MERRGRDRLKRRLPPGCDLGFGFLGAAASGGLLGYLGETSRRYGSVVSARAVRAEAIRR